MPLRPAIPEISPLQQVTCITPNGLLNQLTIARIRVVIPSVVILARTTLIHCLHIVSFFAADCNYTSRWNSLILAAIENYHSLV